MRLKLRDGGFDIGGQHRSSAAAYVAGWAASRALVLRIAPSLAQHLPAQFYARPACLAVPDPAAVPLSPGPAAAIPLPIRHLHDAIAALPAESFATLKDCLDRTDPVSGLPGIPAAAPLHEGDIPVQHSLQAALSRPSHSAYQASFVSDTLQGDAVSRAIHRSQAGYLGMAWFQRRNIPGEQCITNATFLTAVALHLQLPVADFGGRTCNCGSGLTATSGPVHIQGCVHYAKLPRSETFQTAFDSVMLDVCKLARIEGARTISGDQRRCGVYADKPQLRPDGTPVLHPTTGVPLSEAIIPDRVVRNFHDDQMGPSGRYIIDTVVVAPEADAAHLSAAASTSLAAANRAYAKKYHRYAGFLQPRDILLPVAAESWGGLHESVLKRMRKWAVYLRRETKCAVLTDRGESLSAAYLAVWRMRLSVALLHGRVDYVTGALSKLDGVPARSATVANGLCTPLGLVQRMGRLGGTGHMI
jgi:hypothetical protein